MDQAAQPVAATATQDAEDVRGILPTAILAPPSVSTAPSRPARVGESGSTFDRYVPDAIGMLSELTHLVRTSLYPPGEAMAARVVSRILLRVEREPRGGTAPTWVSHLTCTDTAASHYDLRLNMAYIDGMARGDAATATREIRGVVVHGLVGVWRHPRFTDAVPAGVASGVADAVRIRGGFVAPHWTRFPDGDATRWDRGYHVTGHFLHFLHEAVAPGVVERLHTARTARHCEPWDDAIFETLTGRPVTALWDAYRQACAGEDDGPGAAKPVRTLALHFRSTRGFPPIRTSLHVEEELVPHFDALLPRAMDELTSAIDQVRALLYGPKREQPPRDTVTWVVERTTGIAYAVNGTVHLNLNYILDTLKRASPEAQRREVLGVLVHELTHVFQTNGGGHTPGGLIEGIADWVRLRCGYSPPHWRERRFADDDPANHWDHGYQVTAYFLAWIERACARDTFVPDLNAAMRTGWHPAVFETLTGEPVDTLWQRYQHSLPILAPNRTSDGPPLIVPTHP